MRWFSKVSVLSVALVAMLSATVAGACEWQDDLLRLSVRLVASRAAGVGSELLLKAVAVVPAVTEHATDAVTPEEKEEADSGWVGTAGVDSAGVTYKSGDIVRMGEPVVVEADEVVSGDIVVLGSRATVLGTVKGDVVAVGGDLVMGENASIVGDAVSIGGSITKGEGAKVYGQEVSMAGIPLPFLALGLQAARNPFLANALGLLWCLARMLAVVLFCMLVAAVIPRPLGVIASTVREDVVKCGLIGLLIEFLSLPGLFALVISIVGIFAVPAVVLLLIIAGVVGFAASALLVGRRLLPGRSLAAVLAPVALGAAVIQAPALVARLFGFVPFLFPVKLVFSILAGVAFYIAMTVGLGAVWLTRFGRRTPQPKAAASLPPAAEMSPAVPAPPAVPREPTPPPAPPSSGSEESTPEP